MKRLFHSGLFAFALISIIAVSSISFTGCQTAEQTQEARIFYTFRDTWTVAHEAYKGYCELAAQGKVSQRDQQDIDRAWNQFRAGFKIALLASQHDWTSATSENVLLLKDDLITLIRSL